MDKKTPTDAFKEALKGTVRAVAGNATLEVSFSSEEPKLIDKQVVLREPAPNSSHKQIRITRGMADSLSLRASCHDSEIHNQIAPTDAEARMIFDCLEEARYEAIGARHMPGMQENLIVRQEVKLESEFVGEEFSGDEVPLHLALNCALRDTFSNAPLEGKMAKIASARSHEIAAKAKPLFSSMKSQLDDQSAYGKEVIKLLQAFDILTNEDQPGNSRDESENETTSDEQDNQTENEDGDQDDAGDEKSNEQSGEEQGEDLEDTDFSDQSLTDEDTESQQNPAQMQAGMPNFSVLEVPEAFGYSIYTKRFDEECHATDLAQMAELDRLRKLLDRQLETLNRAVARLANRLQRKLLAQQNRSWDFDLDEGVLDAARLTRIVTDPLSPLSFRQESDIEFRDTVVSLLIDNSGSMRGRPIMIAACSADILARTLERCGVKVEILGFTTKTWKGGESRALWESSDKPSQPGRLNDIRHIIYKTADAPWRRARSHLGLMMREGLLKENIDGEALTWAHKRLLARSEQRRILMVISDGAPVDDSTLSVNPGNFLEQHLRKVIEEIETRSPVELIAIGIGHDVTRYYRRAVTITDAEDLAGAMTDKLAELFDEQGPQKRSLGGIR